MKKPPKINVYPLEEKEVPSDGVPFLKVIRKWYHATYPDGTFSVPFLHDIVLRRNIDAVTIIAHRLIDGARFLYIRSAVRPSIMNRFPGEGNLWELPAGLIEADEAPEQCAARETLEELGFDCPANRFKQLGNYIYPCVGICAERIFYFEIELAEERGKPTLDGSPLEAHGEVELISLNAALRLVKEGIFKDAKTELGIRRFAEKYST